MRLSDVSGGAKPMRLSDVQGEPAPAPKKKSSPFMETATDIGMVYPALEAAAHAITGFVGGFPGYLGGGVGQIINRALGRSDELPSEVGKKVGEAFTYQPKTERGKRLAGKVMSPFTALTAAGESGGHAVTDVTGSPAAGALTEGTIQMAPAFLGGPMARAHEATMPKFTGREAVAPKPGQFAPPGEEAPRAPTTGTSSGVPIRLDKLIAEAESLAGQGAPAWTRTTVKEAAKEGAPPPQQGATPLERSVAGATYDWQVPPPPDVAGAIRDIKAAGPQPGQANLPIGETIRNAAGELDRPPAPEAPAGPETPYVGAFEKPKQDNLPFRRYEPDKEYPARPIVIPRSEVRGGEGFSGGKPRKVYELVQTNTPFERVLANSGREWETKAHQDTAREELVAAVRQMSPEDAARFGKLQGLPPEKLMEAAKQYWANIRTDLNNARLADPESSSVQIEAPDAERALFYGKDEPPGRAATADLSLGPDEIGAPPVEGSKTRVDPPEMRESIIAMKDEIGAAETGGKLLIDETTRDTTPGTGEVMGRTPWVGSRWWFDRPDKLSASEARNAIDKYLRGEKLGKRQQGFIDYTRYEIEDRMNEGKAEPGSDQAALDEFGPGTLGANPMLNTKLLHELADTGIKKSIGWANAIQSASETAKKAIAPIFQYARAVQAAKETAQRDVIGGEARAAEIRADYVKSMDEALRANPRFQTVKPETLKEAAREIERAKREIAAGKMRRWLLDNGYAIRRHADEMPGSEDVFREPTLNIRDLHDATGRPLLLREDIIPLAEQMVGAHDISQQRAYAKSWVGKAESMNHATVSWLMQNPLFHLVTTAGKATAYTVPAAGRSGILNYMKTAGEAINDRAQLADMVQHGMQPFPVRHKMEPTGAEAGAFERGMKAIGFDKPYEAYQWMHRHVLANSVNRIQTAFYQMRLEQLIKQAQGEGKTLTPEMVDTFKTTAAQESNPIGGNLPKEEMNQTLYRGLGLTLFSRGLQASTTRMLTRTVENNEIVRSIAKKNGFTDAEAKLITDRNRHFLMAGLALDYAVMQTVANALNYATTSLYDEPDKDGKPGGHFVWDNPGATNASRVFPNSIFLKPKTDDAGNPTGEGIYISNPIRTVRDIIEYAMIPFQVGGGGKPQVLFNKFSPLANLGKTAMTGADWAGRPLSGPTDVAAEVGSMAMPAPLGDVPRYAAEAARSGNQSFLTEGIKRAFDPETAIPTLLGMQPRVSSKDPTTTQEAADQSNDEKKLWARVSRVKQLSKRIDPEVREKQIEAVLEDARKLHMSGSKISEIARVMRNQGVSKAQRSAQGRAQARKADEAPQLDAPPL
jgi:hypothetical protein